MKFTKIQAVSIMGIGIWVLTFGLYYLGYLGIKLEILPNPHRSININNMWACWGMGAICLGILLFIVAVSFNSYIYLTQKSCFFRKAELNLKGETK